MALAAVKLEQIEMRFSTRPILQNVNLEIPMGSSVVIVGPSGHGKTVLLKIMVGLLRATSGRMLLKEQDFWSLGGVEQRLLQRGIGLLFQKNALFDSMTCAENLSFPLQYVKKLTLRECEPLVEKYLESVGILHAKNLFPDEISGGMQKRLGIARALVLEPKIIFYDDPTAGLDPVTSRKIIELILQLRDQQGTTLVSVTNDPMRARQLTTKDQDQIFLVQKGQCISSGNASHLSPQVLKFFHGEASNENTARETLGDPH